MAKSTGGALRRPIDIKPMTIGCYTLTSVGLTVEGTPPWSQHEGVGDFIQRAHQASGFWLADWLRYGESRADWKERLSQIVDATGLSMKTLKNVRAVGRIDPSRRRDDIDFSLHEAVTALPPEDQSDWLERAATEGWSVAELRAHIRASKRATVVRGQATLKGRYRIILADPPWAYDDDGATVDGSLGKAARHYATMSADQVAELPVAAHATPTSTLFLWVTVPMIREGLDVMQAWGFVYKTNRVWNKVVGMPGHYGMQVTHEHVLIGTRGGDLPDVPTPHDDSTFTAKRRSEHSAKPVDLVQFIERHWTLGRRVELFARTRREGWDAFGDDARLWGQS